MRERIREVLERYGQEVTMETAAGTAAARALLLPEAARGERVPEGMCGIGWLDGRTWQYLGQTEVRPGDRIAWRETAFRVCSSRALPLGETVVCWLASLEQEAECGN